MENYISISLETHLFFARIMKEHALFLQAGFPCKDIAWIQKAEFYRKQFEELLKRTVEISNEKIRGSVLKSQELVTDYTIPAEKRTSSLTGIAINTRISEMEHYLKANCEKNDNRMLAQTVKQLNDRALGLLNGLIDFKEKILCEVNDCRLFTANYPLLIEHILREAELYRSILLEIKENKNISCKEIGAKEEFWNQIMMEHALFIRGLLDPTEEALIFTADDFAMDYRALLETAKKQDCKAMNGITEKSLQETLKYRDFKTAGTEGILDCKIRSIILPLLTDHVLREANHYIRILEEKTK